MAKNPEKDHEKDQDKKDNNAPSAPPVEAKAKGWTVVSNFSNGEKDDLGKDIEFKAGAPYKGPSAEQLKKEGLVIESHLYKAPGPSQDQKDREIHRLSKLLDEANSEITVLKAKLADAEKGS